MENIADIKKIKLSETIASLKNEDESVAKLAANRLVKTASSYGLGLDDYLNLAIDLSEEKAANYRKAGMSGFEMALAEMNLPTRNDFKNQVSLAQASDTFSTQPGSRIFFKYTIDNVLRWNNNMNNLENVSDILSGSRTAQGNELIRIVAEDDENARRSFRVGEGAAIPVRKVKYSEKAVKFYKHGSGIEYTYEFSRRASVDVITPFAARVARDLELSKMEAATNIMISGDGVNGGATALSQADLDAAAVDGKVSYDGLLAAFAKAIKAYHPIDTIACDIDAYMQIMKMLGISATSAAFEADQMAEKGGPRFLSLRNIFSPINVVLDNSVPAGKLLMFNRPDTLEELVEANSSINAEEDNVTSQIIKYVKTENTGYALIYPDCRYIYTYKA